MTRGARTAGRAVKKSSRKAVRPRRAPKTARRATLSPTRELDEALLREAVTAEILRIISSAPNDTQPVFDAIVNSGLKLFPQALISIALSDGREVSVAAIAEFDDARAEAWRRRFPFPLTRDYMHSTAILDAKLVDIPDVAAAPAGLGPGARNFLASGYRAITIMPMMRGTSAVGVLSVVRLVPGPLTDEQLALLQTFARQAVIAIENTRLLNELRESLQQQTATSELLGIISRSKFNLAPILQSLVSTAAELCRAEKAVIFRLDQGVYRFAAGFSLDAEYLEIEKGTVIAPGPETAVGRAAMNRQVARIDDALSDQQYTKKDDARIGEVRSIIGVPLLREGEPIGVIALARGRVEPFNDREIELVSTFADQAVIAIENVRLFESEQARTRELSESLEQQTATSEVLRVISSSRGDLEPVFQSMLANGVRLCEAQFGVMWLREGDEFRCGALHNAPPALAALRSREPVIRPPAESPLGRIARTKQIVHVADVKTEMQDAISLGQLAGARTVLAVPMLKNNDLIGGIAIYHQEVRPFTDKQIELVQNFASQAVIAIENARLLNDLHQRTDDLSRSLEDLRTTQDRLVQTEKLASLGQLTAGIAHEIKNPLNFVNNFSGVSAELVGELQEELQNVHFDEKKRAEITDLVETLRGNLDRIVQHGQRADAIVRNMLLHSRQGSAEHRPVDINALVEESINLAYHGARAEQQGFNITLERSLDPAAGAADLFPQDITRVLLNLISNGFYAATRRKTEGNGGDGYEPTLAAATRNLGDSVEIRIRDNGTGIPPEVKEQMFNPFFTTKPAGEGTGLGLSISHDIIVKQHGGSIEVDTQPGAYTEFRIILPRQAASLGEGGGPA